MPLPVVGDRAPAFTLSDQDGTPVKLSDYNGKWVVIYFYPKALTPGCTVQACALRDGMAELKQRGVEVLGISADDPKLLKKFEEKEELNFILLSDKEHKMADAYGAWGEKSMYGKTYMGMTRMTVLVDGDGVVRVVWPKVDPKTHLDNILEWLDSHA